MVDSQCSRARTGLLVSSVKFKMTSNNAENQCGEKKGGNCNPQTEDMSADSQNELHKINSDAVSKSNLSKAVKKHKRYEMLVAKQRERRKQKKKQRQSASKASKTVGPHYALIDSTYVVFGGAGSTGVAPSGAVSTSVEPGGSGSTCVTPSGAISTGVTLGGVGRACVTISTTVSKRDQQRLIRQRLQASLVSGQRIALDLSLDSYMSKKECSRLAQQICRLYGSNRKSSQPAHIYFTGLKPNGHFYKECIRKNSGFLNYIVDMKEDSYLDIFSKDDIVYLSPDSSNVLENLHPEKVYVLGGLVDESVTKNISLCRAEKEAVFTARLPIQEYMTKADTGSYSQILAVNQVFDILLTFMETRDWRKALSAGVPQRKGFIVT